MKIHEVIAHGIPDIVIFDIPEILYQNVSSETNLEALSRWIKLDSIPLKHLS